MYVQMKWRDVQGLRWMIPMDFSIQAKACFDWVMVVMKPADSLVILNVLNLKTPSKG